MSETVAAEPRYLPARMLNEFVYCPRLFYYEWVEGLFRHNLDTVEGAQRHARVDAVEDSLPPDVAEGERIHARSVSLSSETHRLIAKIDLVEGEGMLVSPVDYKRGHPKKRDDGSLEAWEPDRIQIGAQAVVLRENGFECVEGVLFYAATKQRVRVPVDEALVARVVEGLAQARAAAGAPMPLPLVDSPKCPRCSLVGICLPDETNAVRGTSPNAARTTPPAAEVVATSSDAAAPAAPAEGRARELRRLVPARDDLRPLYLNKPGLRVGKSGGVLRVQEKETLLEEVRLGEVSQLNVFGAVQLSTQAVQACCEAEIPIAYFSQGGWFYGVTHGLGVRNIYLRRQQFAHAERVSFRLRFARAVVAGKIRNQRTLLQRNHVEPSPILLGQLKASAESAERAESLEQLLGIEGNAARLYFSAFDGMLKVGPDPGARDVERPAIFHFQFAGRNRRPPRDAVNALLSLAYSVLAKDLSIVSHTVGFDPFLGFYHEPRYGRAALALDLMEPFRPLIAESAVLSAINTRMVAPSDFIQAGAAVALRPEGRKAFFRAYEQRMDALVTHPLFGYRVSYRRILEIQTRLLARVLTGEAPEYPVFTTR